MWYTEPIKWAYGENIVTGVSKTAFSPDAVITREQFAAILYRYAKYKGYDISAVTDVSKYNDFSKTSAYAKPALIWSIAKGFITGMNNTELSPKGNATRAQMAAIIMRYREAQKSSVDIPNKASA